MKHSLLLIVGLCISLSLGAQSRPACITMEQDERKRAQHPDMGSLDDFERVLQHHIAKANQHLQPRMVVTLPVIVHIIHDGEDIGVGTNISHEQVLSQFEVLNEDFRKKSGTPGFNNNPLGADVEIEFCPATIDPNGDPLFERGVDRVNRKDFDWPEGPYSANVIDNTIKPTTFWDSDRYFNIWVVEIQGNVLGFADFPVMSGLTGLPNFNVTADRDGIVVGPRFFGRTGDVEFPYDQGRTATHEVGHWLGVFHPQGRDSGGCNQDDFCDDTPETDNENFGCDLNHQSCGSVDMVRNYMDRSDDACMNIFTECQKTRMRTVLDNSPRRGILASSNACTEDLPPAISFTSNTQIVL